MGYIMRRRILATAIATVLGTSSFMAQAVSLGGIHQKSRLNQSYSATIDLKSVKNSEAYKVKARLAGSVVFEKAGVERFHYLTKLKFKTKVIGGQAVIVITSDGAMREPYLDFLIEANWPNGRTYKEYTVFLDPPITGTQRQTPAISSPRLQRNTIRVTNNNNYSNNYVDNGYTGGDVYQVQNNDTLWNIAARLKTANVSTHQMMMALFDNNPQAFNNHNINNLRAGADLKIPQSETVSGISQTAAKSNFQQQVKDWRLSANEPTTSTRSASPSRAAAELEISSAPSQTMMTTESLSGNSANNDLLKSKLLMMEEQAESAKMEADNFKSEAENLKTQLAEMQRLLDLKNQQMAALESQSMSMPTSTPSSDGMVDVGTEPAMTMSETPQATDSLNTAANNIMDNMASNDTNPENMEAPDPVMDPPTETIADNSTQTAASESEPTEPAVAETFYNEEESTDYTIPIVASTGGALALGLGGLFLYRRKKAQGGYGSTDESILLPADQMSSLNDSIMSDSTESSLDESSFLSEFSENDIDDLQDDTSEVDLLSETDVYIAYGRYEQAEELINQALENKPDELTLLFKKLEIHYAARNTSEFDKTLAHLESLGADAQDQESWMRAMDMQTELSSIDTGYAGSGGAAISVADTLVEDVDSLAMNEGLIDETSDFNSDIEMDMDLSTLEDIGSSGNDFELDLSSDDDIDLDLSGGGDDGLDLNSVVDEVIEEDDLDKTHVLGSSPFLEIDVEEDEVERTLTMKSNQSNEGTIDDLEQSLESLEAIESDFNIVDDDITELGMSDNDDADVDFNLDDGDDDFSVSSLNEIDSGLDQDLSQLSELNLDDLDLGDPNDDSILASITLDDDEPREDMNVDLGSEVVDDDEVETKLDLANAYAEMGDEDGARSIIEEIMSEGNEAQKDKAQSILQRLG